MELSELQMDAITEIFNIGVGRAASGLSLIVKEKILLTAPLICICRPSEATRLLEQSNLQKITSVSQRFYGPFDATALLAFPEEHAINIVRMMLGAQVLSSEEVSEFENEAMCEVGNVILNACISALSDSFHTPINSGLPIFRLSTSETLIRDNLSIDDGDPYILLLRVTMTIHHAQIDGQIMFLMNVPSLSTLVKLIDQFLIEMNLI